MPNGEACIVSEQCQQLDSRCVKGICQRLIGSSCSTSFDCPDRGGNDYDCGCDRKCYLLNGPVAPTPPGVDPCPAKQAAWLAAAPPNVTISSVVWFPSMLQGPGSLSAVLEPLNASLRALAIDFVCCFTCRSSIYRFSSNIMGGYQLDCNTKTLKRLPDTCDNTRAAPALLNCWPGTPTSTAPTTTLGFGVLFVLAVLL